MNESKSKTKAFIITFIVVFLLLLLGYYLFFSGNKTTTPSTTTASSSSITTNIGKFFDSLFGTTKPTALSTTNSSTSQTTDTTGTGLGSKNTSSGTTNTGFLNYLYNSLFGGSTTPVAVTPTPNSQSQVNQGNGNLGTGVAPVDNTGGGTTGNTGAGGTGTGVTSTTGAGAGTGLTPDNGTNPAGGFGSTTGDGSGSGFTTTTGAGPGSGDGSGNGFSSGGGFGITPGLTPLPTPTTSGSGAGGPTLTGVVTPPTTGGSGPTLTGDTTTVTTTSPVGDVTSNCDDTLTFTADEQAKLDDLLRQYYLLAPTLKTTTDITILQNAMAANQATIDRATSLTQSCVAEKADPTYTGPQAVKDNPYYKAGDTTPKNTGAGNSTGTQIGPYFWGGSLDSYTGDAFIPKAKALADNTGAHVIRITLASNADETYKQGTCIPNFTLTNLARRADFNSIITDPQFSTVIITAYDGASFSDCTTGNFADPNFYTPANTAKIEQEYTDLANYLSQFNKTFILSNWEGDNTIYCGNSYAYRTGSLACPNAPNALQGFTKWINARTAGVHASRATNVFSGMEFSNVNDLKNNNIPSVLYDVLPNINADYFLYSSYESLNNNSLSADIDKIRSMLQAQGDDPTHLIIGEYGFDGDPTTAASKLAAATKVIQSKNIPYAIIWTLLGGQFGLYDTSANPTALYNAVFPQTGTTSLKIPLSGSTGAYLPDFSSFETMFKIW